MINEKICVSQSILFSMISAAWGPARVEVASVSPVPSPASFQAEPASSGAKPDATPLRVPAGGLAPANEKVVPPGPWLTLTWYGQATFTLGASTRLAAVLDPTTPETGYRLPAIEHIDLVTASHEHSDHNAVGLVSGKPLVLKGLAGKDWAQIDQVVKGVRVRSVGAYHDDTQGAQRGKNAIFVFDIDGLRLAHLGDLGHLLSAEQVQAVGPLDVLLAPVGGTYTIDAQTALRVIEQLGPRVVVPMHYQTPDLAPSLARVLAPVEVFLQAVEGRADIRRVGQSLTIEKNRLPEKLTVYVLKYKP